MIFGRRKPKVTRDQQLALRPRRAIAEAPEPDGQGGGRLRVTLQPRGIVKMLVGMSRRPMTKTFELDAVGLYVWQRLDGKTTVKQLIRSLAKQYNLNLREAEAATLAFLQMLAKRGLVGPGDTESKRG